MRTNIVINDELMREAMKCSRERTKRGIVEEALKTLIAVRTAERRLASYRRRAEELDQRLAGLILRERPLDLLSLDRSRR